MRAAAGGTGFESGEDDSVGLRSISRTSPAYRMTFIALRQKITQVSGVGDIIPTSEFVPGSEGDSPGTAS